MAGLLGSYKKGDRLDSYRQGGGLLDVLAETELGQGLLGLATDPVGQAKKAVSTVANKVREANRKNKEAFESGNNDMIASRALDYSQDALGFAPIGMTVWHGSPHKFDKFDMSKIGTGEGAQAYGHGLYMAESPGVAKSYAENLARPTAEFSTGMKVDMGQPISRGQWRTATSSDDPIMEQALRSLQHNNGDANAAANALDSFDDAEAIDLLKHWANNPASMPKIDAGSNMYKVDIPDEAVARFLDWDKPLSQQAPEVQAAIGALEAKGTGFTYKDIVDALNAAPHLNNPKDYAWAHPSGQEIYNSLGDSMMVGNRAIGQAEAAQKLKELGIPGIRYLDGGSRSAGQGSSNFVLFSDDLPRILEINGQATGNQPWARGEWGGLLDEAPKTAGLLDSAPMDEFAKDRLSRIKGIEEDYRLPNLHNAVPKEYLPKQYGKPTVTIYRGVPSSVKDAVIRPGDWVGLDPKYAAQHGTGETGKSQLLKMEVPADHVGWAGTDMNEFFYVPR